MEKAKQVQEERQSKREQSPEACKSREARASKRGELKNTAAQQEQEQGQSMINARITSPGAKEQQAELTGGAAGDPSLY